MSLGLIITAAGASTRFGEPKQFYNIGGTPMLTKTLQAFKGCSDISECIVTINESGKARLEEELSAIELPFTVKIVLGGVTRRDSVENAVNSLETTSKVLIHDGARPFVTGDVIQRVSEAITSEKAVIPGVPSVDTLKVVQNGHVDATLNRDEVYRIQTPQAFDVETLKKAYAEYTGPEATDEAMLVEKLGLRVAVVLGDEQNKKVTFKSDCN